MLSEGAAHSDEGCAGPRGELVGCRTMKGWRIWALAAFVIGLAVAMFVYLRALPAVTEDELREAVAEVEHIRTSLDDIECRRPALLGAPTQDALSLEEFLSADGPFAECWAAVGNDEWHITIADGAHFEGYGEDELEDEVRVSRVLAACSALPVEVDLQARTEDRCMPSPSSSEPWRRHLDEQVAARAEALFGTALAIITAHTSISAEAKLRLLLQGIATARDFGQGPADGRTAGKGAYSERILTGLFSQVLNESTRQLEHPDELTEALGPLAEMPIDARSLILSDATRLSQLSPSNQTLCYQSRPRDCAYANATLLPRVLEFCPADATASECAAHFPFLSDSEPSPGLLGPRMIRDEVVLFAQATTLDNARMLVGFMQGARNNARALQRLLQWSADRANGRCPEVSGEESSGEMGTATTEFIAYRDGDVYELITPGPERDAFVFRCPLSDTDHTTGTEGL